MTTGIVLLNFGEPAVTEESVVHEYLTRIFYTNADLEDPESEEAAWERARELAGRRLPGLLEEYEAIGGSPLNDQAMAQQRALESTIADRGYDVDVYHAMQFVDPLIDDAAEALAEDDIETVVALPMYPLCGPSTTVMAIDDLEEAIDSIEGYDPTLQAITGWHRHPLYTRVRSDAIRSFATGHGIDLHDPTTAMIFSAHGTPTKYLDAGSRYDTYVEEYCATVAATVGIEEYHLGYQNHESRDIEWTEPEVESLISSLPETIERVVVEPTSFIHEQSETLSELDIDLAADADAAGLDFYRVPVPHDDPRFGQLFADLIEPFVAGFEPNYHQLRPCQCRAKPGTYCLNAPR
ncbi:MAG: ferrochelatase [Natrialbaceae archaeon]|nr:ferrochelatase [Natrialbaceae archaeon]